MNLIPNSKRKTIFHPYIRSRMMVIKHHEIFRYAQDDEGFTIIGEKRGRAAKREAESPFSLEEKGFRDEVRPLNAKR